MQQRSAKSFWRFVVALTLEQLKQRIEFVPDFGPAEGATASTVTWELSGSNPLRCENTEAYPGQRHNSPTVPETAGDSAVADRGRTVVPRSVSEKYKTRHFRGS